MRLDHKTVKLACLVTLFRLSFMAFGMVYANFSIMVVDVISVVVVIVVVM